VGIILQKGGPEVGIILQKVVLRWVFLRCNLRGWVFLRCNLRGGLFPLPHMVGYSRFPHMVGTPPSPHGGLFLPSLHGGCSSLLPWWVILDEQHWWVILDVQHW